MIRFNVAGDILTTGRQAFICPVNCVGTMGAGLARQVRDKLPSVNDNYRKWCIQGDPRPGDFIAVDAYNMEKARTQGILDVIIKVVCLATKEHWRNPSQLNWIATGLENVRKFCEEYEVTSIAIPKLGCGLGELNWNDVRPLIIEKFKDFKGDVDVYGECPEPSTFT